MEACRVLTISYSFRLGLYGVLHAFFRRSRILLTFSRNQVIYSAFSILLLVEGTCKGHCIIQEQSKEPDEGLHTWITPTIALDLCFISKFATIIYVQLFLIS